MTVPRMRAGDADRQQSVDRLARHFVEGRLDSGEYDERVRAAYASIYLDELAALFGDLPAAPTPVDIYHHSRQPRHGLVGQPALPGYGGGRSLVQRAQQMLMLMLGVLWIALVVHGFLFPAPLILIGLMRFNAARRGQHHPGPGSRR